MLRRLGSVQSVKEVEAILPHGLGIGVALSLLPRQPRILDPSTIPFIPFQGGRSLEPARRDRGKFIECSTQSLRDQLQAIQFTDGGEHMGGVGPLLPTGLEEPQRDTAPAACLTKFGGAPGRKRSRNSLSAEKSKPASVRSKPRRYFQSMRARTASAAWRSARFSRNCMMVTSAKRHGGRPGCPTRGKSAVKSLS